MLYVSSSSVSRALALGVFVGLLGLAVGLLPVMLGLEENLGLGMLFRLRGEKRPPPEIVMVRIDAAAAERLGLPHAPERWPRSLHARLVDTLAAAGAAVIAFDMVFDTPREPGDDRAFADAIRRAGNVVLVDYIRGRNVPATRNGPGMPQSTLHIEQLIPPLPIFERAAVASGPFPLPKIPVQVYQYWTFKAGAAEVPTLPAVMLQLFALDVYDAWRRLLESVRPDLAVRLPADREAIFASLGLKAFMHTQREVFMDHPRLAAALLEKLRRTSATDASAATRRLLKALIRMYQKPHSRYLNFYGPPGAIPAVSYARVLDAMADGDHAQLDVRGKVVLIGLAEYTRMEQEDGYYTVFSQANGLNISGVEIAATAFANLLDDTPVQPPNDVLYLLVIVVWGLVLGFVFWLLPTTVAAAGVLVLAGLYCGVASALFASQGTWYPLVVPLGVQVPVVGVCALVWKYIESTRERQNIKEAFGYYVPDQMVQQLAKSVGSITSNRLVYGTCLFTDAEQYTVLAERMTPHELGDFINAYYASLFEPVRRYGGMVSDVIGDAMLSLWTTDQPDRRVRERACLAALDIAAASERFKQESGTAWLPTRIGLHAGQMLLGNVGALNHYEYRAVGDIVNTASRVEDLNKRLGTRILATAEVVHQLDGLLTRELGTFLLRGKSTPLVVHELLCRKEEVCRQQQALCAIFAAAIAAYKRRAWHEAMLQFMEAMAAADQGEDGPAHFYIQLCEQYQVQPPGQAWKGVVQIT